MAEYDSSYAFGRYTAPNHLHSDTIAILIIAWSEELQRYITGSIVGTRGTSVIPQELMRIAGAVIAFAGLGSDNVATSDDLKQRALGSEQYVDRPGQSSKYLCVFQLESNTPLMETNPKKVSIL